MVFLIILSAIVACVETVPGLHREGGNFWLGLEVAPHPSSHRRLNPRERTGHREQCRLTLSGGDVRAFSWRTSQLSSSSASAAAQIEQRCDSLPAPNSGTVRVTLGLGRLGLQL